VKAPFPSFRTSADANVCAVFVTAPAIWSGGKTSVTVARA
jgi:hypothetical protein